MATGLSTPVGTMAFGNLVGPAPDLNQKMEWLCALVFTEEQSANMLEAVAAEIEKAQKDNADFPSDVKAISMPYKQSMKKNEAGEKVADPGKLLWIFKRKVEKFSRGVTTTRSAPTLLDSQGRVCNGKIDSIPPQTTGRVIYRPYPWTFNNKAGIALGLEGFQIGKLGDVATTPDLPPIDDGWQPDNEETTVDLSSMLG